MRQKITSLLLLFFCTANLLAVECEFAYQNASYGFQHAETALEANNVTQLKQYAQRSLEAIQKALQSSTQCGCEAANEAGYDAIENLNKALEKTEYERVRFFVNKGRSNAQEILKSLDICSASPSVNNLDEQENDIVSQQQQLLEQQRLLEEKQRQLQEQIATQKELQKKLAMQKAEMLKAQKELKLTSEETLSELETLINEFTIAMGCKTDGGVTSETFIRSLAELESESLDDTKGFYIAKAKEMASTLMNRLAGCEWKE